MKKLLCVLILVIVAGGASVFAVDLTTYPVGMEAGDFLVNVGVGLGSYSNGKMRLPPISASLDYNLSIGGLPFYVGGIFGFGIWGQNETIGRYDYKDRWSVMSIGGRFGYHFNWGVKNLDTYLGMVLGAQIAMYKQTWDGNSQSSTSGGFLWGFDVGVRYYFTPVVGIFGEFGWSGLSFAKLGLALKF